MLAREQERELRAREFERRRREISAQIEVLQSTGEAEAALLNREATAREDRLALDRVDMGVSHRARQLQPLSTVRPSKDQTR